MLKITTHTGAVLTFETLPERHFRGQSGIESVGGYDQQRVIPFNFVRAMRARLPEIEQHAGKNVVQQINRSGRIQLMSDKPCAMCRFDWDAPKHKVNEGWGDIYSSSHVFGVYQVTTATVQGMDERLTITVFVGSWLWQGGEAVLYE